MGLERFERRLERLVEGTFAKAYRRGLQPIELGRRLTREMDLRRTVGVRRVIAPNAFDVVLSSADMDRFSSFAEELAEELVDAAREHARDEDYGFLGPVEVRLLEDDDLPEGVFEITAQVRPGPGAGPVARLVLPDGSRHPIGDAPVVLGRLPGCDVVLDDPNVSRRHAEIRCDDGQVVLTDLGSTNGTLVNGVPTRSQRLADGDQITLGRTTIAVELE